MKLFVQHAKGDMTHSICKKLNLKETLEEFNLENDEEMACLYSKILNLRLRTFKFIK